MAPAFINIPEKWPWDVPPNAEEWRTEQCRMFARSLGRTNLTAICVHSKPITEICEECEAHWAASREHMGTVCTKCGKIRAKRTRGINGYSLVRREGSSSGTFKEEPIRFNTEEAANAQEGYPLAAYDAALSKAIAEIDKIPVGTYPVELNLAEIIEDGPNGLTSRKIWTGKGPHELTDRWGNKVMCGGPGKCKACDGDLVETVTCVEITQGVGVTGVKTEMRP